MTNHLHFFDELEVKNEGGVMTEKKKRMLREARGKKLTRKDLKIFSIVAAMFEVDRL